ncbi:hypothetical protein N2152v2_009750 [Parachlorella kessleri]
MDALGESIVRKLQQNFKGQAGDEASRRIIAEEVVRFIRSSQGVEEEDVAALEEQIRHRLAGKGITGKAEKLEAKQAAMKQDDWSKVCLYMSYLAKEDERRKLQEAKTKKVHNRAALDGQIAEVEQRVQEEKQQKKVDHQQQEKELEEWHKSQQERKVEQKHVMERLKQERQAQLEEQARRREIAAALKKKGEEEMTVRIALEMKRQMEADAATKQKAKEGLKAFLASNELNQKMKEQERLREFQDDIRYMKEYSESLEKQERQRLAQLERVKAVQARQVEDAKQRPPVKRWVDPAIIERQFQEKQAALAEDDAKRKAARAARTQKFKQDVAGQLQEKERERLTQLEKQQEELVKSMEAMEVNKKLQQDAKHMELEKMRGFKADLDKQIAENKAKRQQNSMSETERSLNSKLMQSVEKHEGGQLIAAAK